MLFFFMLLAEKSFEIFPKHNKVEGSSEYVALNLIISEPFTKK